MIIYDKIAKNAWTPTKQSEIFSSQCRLARSAHLKSTPPTVILDRICVVKVHSQGHRDLMNVTLVRLEKPARSRLI